MSGTETWPGRLAFFGLTRRRIAVFVSLTMLAAAFEGFGMAMFLPVLEFIEKGNDLALLAGQSTMWERLINVFRFLGWDITLASLLAAALGVMLLRVGFIYARQLYSAWLGQEILHVTRSNMFDAYMAMDYEAYAGLSSGGVINILTTESRRAGGSFSALFALVSNLVVLAGFACVLLWISTPLTAMAVAFLGVAGLAVVWWVRHTRQYSFKATEANDGYSRMVLERLGGFRLVKLTAAGEREASRVRVASGRVRDMLFWLAKLVAGVDLIMEPVVLLAGGGVLYMAVNVFGMGLSEVGLFGLILLRMLPLVKETMKSRQSWQSCAGSMAAVLDGYANAEAHREACTGTRSFGPGPKTIVLDDVAFTYNGARRQTLSDVRLEIPSGGVTALVGPSGAGKTTLAELIPRLRVPQSGRVLYDGVGGSEYDLDSLRSSMAFVSQDAAILDDTVSGNLRFVRPDASDDELWSALDRARAKEFVAALPEGLETRLGERGVMLSGGQKQRLSLARALLQDTGVLILDEPTSALDSETEADVQRAIDDLRSRGETTIVIIAHRLSTIRGADQIVVLRDGRIVEQGSHKELMVSEEWYSRISGMQSVGGGTSAGQES